MLIPFTKAHGTGNHFVIIYLPECPKLELNKKIIEKICDSNIGVGADGLLALSEDNQCNFKMDYYNSDGTWETMCANGARCAGLFLYEKNIINKKATFICGDGSHDMVIDNADNIAITIFPPEYTSDEITIDNFSGFSVNSGAKHFVIEIDDDSLDLKSIGRKVRNADAFFPYGTNVNFVKKITSSELQVITYEKGVEKIMQSCGSGSVAAAFHMQKKYNLNNNLTIRVLGGKLHINANQNWDEVWLKGPAKLLFNSKINVGEYINDK